VNRIGCAVATVPDKRPTSSAPPFLSDDEAREVG
jgi:hypothetical protein